MQAATLVSVKGQQTDVDGRGTFDLQLAHILDVSNRLIRMSPQGVFRVRFYVHITGSSLAPAMTDRGYSL